MTIKVIGCGNSLAADDGVGVRVAQELNKLDLPPQIEVKEGGTDPLAVLEMIRGADRVILVDAVCSEGGEPGSICRLTTKDLQVDRESALSLHQVDIPAMLRLGDALFAGEIPENIAIVGVRVENVSAFSPGLSGPVEKAVPGAIDTILEELGLDRQRVGYKNPGDDPGDNAESGAMSLG